MNGSCESPQPTLCGCCRGIGTETPEPITNRPALSAISYRVGTHTTFLASLLAALSDSDLPALAPLRTRDPSDFSIALLDAWATSLDILSFYQERIANESYLRTAVDSASVFALAQLVGYKPSPGVGASTFLAFTLNGATGSPDNVLIPAGTRVQSVPNPGQQPQVFETSSDLTAVIELNAIPAQTTVFRGLNPGDTSIWLQGTSNNLNPGDALLFVNQAFHQQAASGTPGIGTQVDLHFVSSVQIDAQAQQTQVVWDQPLLWPTTNDTTAYIYVLRKRAALFGAQSIDPRSLVWVTGSGLASVKGWPGGSGAATSDWNFPAAFTSPAINLDASYPGLAPGQDPSAEPQWVVLVDSNNGSAVFNVQSTAETSPNAFLITSKTTQLTLANGLTIPSPTSPVSAPIGSTYLQTVVIDTRQTTVYVQSNRLTPVDPPYVAWSYDGTYARQTGLLKPVEGSQLEIVTGEQLSSGQPVAISGKRLRLQVGASFSPTSDSTARFVPAGGTGSLPLAAGQMFLVDAFPPTPAPHSADLLWSVITTDGAAGTLEINTANVLLIPADQKDPIVGETATISQLSVLGPVVTLSFGQTLARIYDRSAVTVNANVVAATQGETMNEILGSGDATNPALQFSLKQSPLTYVSSSLNNGAVSTLQVWVNNLRWHEVNNFLDSGPRDRVFITQTDASQKVTVQFGDGEEGERPPTGQMNIRAVYRKGIGSAGNVQSGQLSQALDRPQGLKSVTNPDPGTGGADPDTASAARASAPLQVLTLGRVVSLEDYQNYALAFAGIAKALATWTWVGRKRSVFLTLAGANGIAFQPDDLTITSLLQALQDAGNPHVPVYVANPSYNPVLFEVGANLQIDTTDYDPTQVLAQVWQSLSTTFSFDQRQMGQGVAQSEIIAVIQQTAGVIAVEVTAFNRQGQPPAPGAALPAVLLAASSAAGQQSTPSGAEMLLIDPASQGNFEVWS